MLLATTLNQKIFLILILTSLPYKRTNLDMTTEWNPKIEQFWNLENFLGNWMVEAITQNL